MAKIPDRETRREIFMVATFILGFLTFTHWLWGWPLGAPTQTSTNPAVGATTLLGQIPWMHFLEGLPLLAVGILYYLGRRHGKVLPAQVDMQAKLSQQQTTHENSSQLPSPG